MSDTRKDEDGDDDRTRIGSVPADKPADESPAPDQGSDDATQFAAEPEAAAPEDRTRIATDSPPGDSGAEDRTRLSDPIEAGQGAETAAEDAASASEPPPLPQPRSGAISTGATVTVGTLINNNYEVQQVLKAGGMGEVYRGVEIGTGDPVAIKAILPELAEDEKAGLLFKREARTLRQLADEAIVRYYNYVHDRDLDRYFLVMEFIGGVPLSDHTAAHGPITPEAGRTLMRRLAKGLAKAHAQDVIHRDLSPDNVMLPDGIVAEAVLIDFGIAKSNVVTEGTMHGQFAGKFKYVAPEQLGHFEGRIGPATDIYGLALMIAAAVIGKPLDMGSSIVEAVKSRQAIPDLSEVPAELRPILSHMLEPDPADRPASMDEVRRMLDAPELIPAQYRGDLPLPPPTVPTGTTGRPGFVQAPPGLQAPPVAGQATTAPPARGTAPPQPLPAAPEEADGSGGRVLGLLAAVFIAILGGAGWYAWSEGLIGGTTETALPAPPATPRAEGIPPPLASTREGFLAAFDTGPCTYASRIASGSNAGMVEGFSSTGEGFAGLPTAYEEAFGARPAILPRTITAQQCAALEFARALQGRGGVNVQMALNVDSVESGSAIGGQIAAVEGKSLWVALISPLGAVYNLTERLSEPVGGRVTLNFGLNLAQGAEAAPQLILAVAAEAPLASAAAARDGVAAAELLPRILSEIEARGGGATADLSFLLLSPAEPSAPD